MKDWRRAIGVLAAVFGGLAAIGICVWFTHSAGSLWAIILLMWGVQRVVAARQPVLLGAVLGLCYLGLGIVGYYVKSPQVLWAMILINWIGNALI